VKRSGRGCDERSTQWCKESSNSCIYAIGGDRGEEIKEYVSISVLTTVISVGSMCKELNR